MEIEQLNKECSFVGNALVANVNLKAAHNGQVVDKVFADGDPIEPGLWAATYNATDAFVSVRNLPVDAVDQDIAFDMTLIDYQEPVQEERQPLREGVSQ